MRPLGIFNLGHAAWPDIARMLRPTDPAPQPVFSQETLGTPIDRMHEALDNLGLHLLDLRGRSRTIHYDPHEWGYFRDDHPKKNIPKRGRAHGVLPWQKRTAIMLHITAAKMGPRRFIGTPCHAAVADDATVVLCHPNDAYVYHGHAANRFAVGVEISSKAGQITEMQAKAARLLVRYIVEDLRAHRGEGAPIAMMAHRQSHWSRPRDPGSVVWQQVALPMMAALLLVEGPVVGSGRPIPPDGEPWA
jgi:hypothetical protein